ncbi:MAG: FG-GAP repeat protein, partial [Planctomycetes bacterium]|nr:FG-GAP repeat protein [Planctomycetota bacterium]
MSHLFAGVCVFVLLLVGVVRVGAQCPPVALGDPAALSGGEFGHAVAFDGVHAVVGSPGAERAVVYRFDGSGFVEVTTLTSSSVTASSRFGSSVAIVGTLIVVGAPNDDEVAVDAGAVVVFRFDGSTWVEETKLTAAAPAVGDQLGRAGLATDGQQIAAAAPSPATPRVVLFRLESGLWIPWDELLPQPGSDDGFGADVDFGAGWLVATSEAPTGVQAPSAHIFRRVAGVYTFDTLVTGMIGDAWRSVSLSADRCVVGATGANGGTGEVRTFRYDGSGWVDDGVIDGTGNALFGSAVAVHGDALVVGAEGSVDPGAGVASGRAVLYRKDAVDVWTLAQDLPASLPEAGLRHG